MQENGQPGEEPAGSSTSTGDVHHVATGISRAESPGADESDGGTGSQLQYEAPMQDSEYLMRPLTSQRQKRGKAIILNHLFRFHEVLDEREGTEVDEKNLFNLFTRMGLDVYIMRDCDFQDIIDKLNQVASDEDHSAYDLLVIVVLTHGTDEKLSANDGMYELKELWMPFSDENCPSLKGKPKLFIVQACRGPHTDQGEPVAFLRSERSHHAIIDQRKIMGVAQIQTYSSGVDSMLKRLTEPDMHLALATGTGCRSFKSTLHGSTFVQGICRIMQQCNGLVEYQQMMTNICRNVAVGYVAITGKEISHGGKQVPSSQSTLLKNLYIPME